jgi:phosphotransacetylase
VLIITDAAISISPTLEEKKVDIVQNAIDLALPLRIETPKVAILSAMEKVNPKLQSTVEAAALGKMADRGQIAGGVLDGPLALGAGVPITLTSRADSVQSRLASWAMGRLVAHRRRERIAKAS